MATILLIEDDVVQRDLYRDLLYYNGFDVLVAGSAEAGFQVAIEARPDLIVLDIILPGVNGLVAAQRLSHTPATSAIPIICMSAHDVSLQLVVQSGAREFLAKPVDPSALIRAIWRHLGSDHHNPISPGRT